MTRPARTGRGRFASQRASWSDFEIAPAEVPGVIDEIPALAALAAMMPAGRTIDGSRRRELRVKESDRITRLAAGFRAMGSQVEEYEDGFRLDRPAAARRRVARLRPAITAWRWPSRSRRRAPSGPVTIHDAAVGRHLVPWLLEKPLALTLAGA